MATVTRSEFGWIPGIKEDSKFVAVRIDEHVDGDVELTIFDQPSAEELANPFAAPDFLERLVNGGSRSHSTTIPADQRATIAAALLGYPGKSVNISIRQETAA